MTVFSENRKAYHEYEILEKYEAGIVLEGHEVKSVKKGKVSLQGAYVKEKNGEFFLIGATVTPYQPQNINKSYDPQRTRKLLLNKKEINSLIGKSKEKGLTIVPLKLYNKRDLIKLLIALVRPRKKRDKREIIKKREEKRKIGRMLKQF